MISSLDYMTTPGGSTLRYGVWRLGGAEPKGAVVLLSGRNEFLEKYAETIEELCARGWHVFSFDWRGQGLSTRMAGVPQRGHIDDYETYIQDLDRFLRQVVLPRAARPVACLAHSMGAHILLRHLARHPGVFSRVVLTSPMIDICTGVFPAAFAKALSRFAVRIGGARAYAPGEGDYRPPRPGRFNDNHLTSDYDRYMRPHRMVARNPELALGGVTYGWLRATFDSIEKLAAPGVAESIAIPVLMVSSGADRVVSAAAQSALCGILPDCRRVSIPDARHEILMEQDRFRALFWRAFDGFMAAGLPERNGASGRQSELTASRASQRA